MALVSLNLLCLFIKYLRIFIYFALGAWLTVAFVATTYCYNKKPRDRVSFSNSITTADSQNKDTAFMEISTAKDGKFYGHIVVNVTSKEVAKIVEKGSKFFVQYFTINDNPQYGKWIRLVNVEKKDTNYELSSDKELLLYELTYANRYFPFDKFYLTFGPSLIIADKDGKTIYENQIPYHQVNIRSPLLYSTEQVIKNTKIKELLGFTDGKGVYLAVSHSIWFLWLFGGILGFLLIPVIMLFHADIKSISFDIISLVISFMSVRSFLVGETKQVYPLDMYFCFLATISGLIIIYKLCHNELKKRTSA